MIKLNHWRKEGPIDPRIGGALFVAPQSYSNASSKGSGTGNWYEALAEAWGQVLDKKAGELVSASNQIGNDGNNNPSAMIKASALAQEFAFTSNMAATANSSVGNGLETVSKRQ